MSAVEGQLNDSRPNPKGVPLTVWQSGVARCREHPAGEKDGVGAARRAVAWYRHCGSLSLCYFRENCCILGRDVPAFRRDLVPPSSRQNTRNVIFITIRFSVADQSWRYNRVDEDYSHDV